MWEGLLQNFSESILITVIFSDEEGYLQSPWPMKLFWAIFNMAANSAVVISISYYAFLAIFDHRGMSYI